MECVKGGEKKYFNEGVVGICGVVVLDFFCVFGGWRIVGEENVYNWFVFSGVWCDSFLEVFFCLLFRNCFWENISEGVFGGEGCFLGFLLWFLGGDVVLFLGIGFRVVYGDFFLLVKLLIEKNYCMLFWN